MMSDIRIDSDGNELHTSEIRDFILFRELNEVYLLLDHISGRWDKTFSSLNSTQGGEEGGQVSIREICEIHWPSSADQHKQAEMAEVLLKAKDRLNAAARPANGITIAFTVMVLGEGNRPARTKKGTWQQETPPEKNTPEVLPADGNGSGEAKKIKPPPSRVTLAHWAFPGLIQSAAEFRWRVRRIVEFLALVLCVTCLLSWYAATVNGILTHLDTVRNQERELEKKIALAVFNASQTGGALNAVARVPTPTNSSPPIAGSVNQESIFLLGDFSKNFCNNKGTPTDSQVSRGEAIAMCQALHISQQEHAAISANLDSWTTLTWRKTTNPTPEMILVEEERGRVVGQLLINSILPFLYGILGAGAAVVRDLWAKTRESLLSPRDSTLAIGQLALGAITGACIGLFASPSTGASSEGILGNLALTASALAFVAGFGVEGAFLALESLVRRVFNLSAPTDARSRRRS
jgi:hypothetical protein